MQQLGSLPVSHVPLVLDTGQMHCQSGWSLLRLVQRNPILSFSLRTTLIRTINMNKELLAIKKTS